jgi:YbgC/YbaW family acyl-CoA thioester hydrolase
MPHYQRKVALSETDATGVLYFTNLLKYATEAFESFLEERGFSLASYLRDSDYLFPIVEAKANYFHPLTLGDLFTMRIEVEKMGSRSLHLLTLFEKEGIKVGEARMVHVLISRKSQKSLYIPEALRQQLCPQGVGP